MNKTLGISPMINALKNAFLMIGCSLFLTSSLSAFLPSNGVENGIGFGGEWIYFSPVSETVKYAELFIPIIPFPTAADNVDYINNRLDDFYSGYRVYGSYSCCDFLLFGRWSRLKANHSSSITAPPGTLLFNPFSTLATNFATFASDKKNFTYSSADGLVGIRLPSPCCWLEVTILGGAHYASIHSDDQTRFVITAAPVPAPFTVTEDVKSHFWGVGPELGIVFESCFSCGLSLQCEVAGAFLIGKPRGNNHYDQNFALTTTTNHLDWPSYWRVVPYSNIRLGLDYSFAFPNCLSNLCTNGLQGNLEIGYEGLAYYDALLDMRTVTDSRTFHNTVLHGPFVSFALYF